MVQGRRRSSRRNEDGVTTADRAGQPYLFLDSDSAQSGKPPAAPLQTI